MWQFIAAVLMEIHWSTVIAIDVFLLLGSEIYLFWLIDWFIHTMIRWAMQAICFDFTNTRHVIAGNGSAKPHGRFRYHTWIQYGPRITILISLIYLHSMFHLHPLYFCLLWSSLYCYFYFFSVKFHLNYWFLLYFVNLSSYHYTYNLS